jgi:hypothetical protein
VAYVAATNIISPESKYEITLFLTLVIDLWLWYFKDVWGRIESLEK